MLYFDIETTGLDNDAKIVAAVTRTNGTSTAWAEKTVTPLSQEKCDQLASALTSHNGPIVSFNGTSFDFRILCSHVSTNALRQKLVYTAVYNHQDIMLDFLGSNGYCSSLQSFLEGTLKKCAKTVRAN